jgi:hypothetical protein
MERNIYTKGIRKAYISFLLMEISFIVIPQSGFRIVVTVGEFDNSIEIFDEKVDPMSHFQNA